MRFGLCCAAEAARDAVSAGFDYAEVGASNLPEKLEMLSGTPVEATNLFFPGDFRLFEPAMGDLIGHSLSVIDAAASLGVQVMVVGSGNQRRSGPEVSRSDALARFVEITAEIAEIARTRGIIIAPESLTRDETNVANDLGEMAQALFERDLAYTADSYHVLRESYHDGAAPDWEVQLPFPPAHVHFADFPRNVPELEDEATLAFLRRLKDLGYDSRISFEGSLGEHDMAFAFERLRRLWEMA